MAHSFLAGDAADRGSRELGTRKLESATVTGGGDAGRF